MTEQDVPNRAMPARLLGPRVWLLGALFVYIISLLWSFVASPLMNMGGLFFYYYRGQTTTILIFLPLVLLATAVVTSGPFRGVVVILAILTLGYLLSPAQSAYLRYDNAVGTTTHVVALVLTLIAGLRQLVPALAVHRTPASARLGQGIRAGESLRAAPSARLRQFGSVLLGVAAVSVFVLLAPSHTTSNSQISSVISDDAGNQSLAKGAPQQTVVNGWATRDLLEIIARQGEEARDNRPAAFALIGLLALLLFIGTSTGVLHSGSGRTASDALKAPPRVMEPPRWAPVGTQASPAGFQYPTSTTVEH